MRTMDSLLAFSVVTSTNDRGILGPSSINAMIAVSVVSIPDFARISRASILAQKEKITSNLQYQLVPVINV